MRLIFISLLPALIAGFWGRLFGISCPNCKQSRTPEQLKRRLVSSRGGFAGAKRYDTWELSYRCNACGHEWTQKREF
jgi:uncharacterized Zn finger protein